MMTTTKSISAIENPRAGLADGTGARLLGLQARTGLDGRWRRVGKGIARDDQTRSHGDHCFCQAGDVVAYGEHWEIP